MANIAVFCGSSRALDRHWLDLAYGVGVEIGRRGHRLVSGGGCVGLMGAVADGARSAGAHTLGIMPQLLVDQEVADLASDELIVTPDLATRKNLMIEKADAFLTLPGGLGTLDELFEVWTTAMLALHAKPIVLLNVDGFYRGLVEWLRGLVPSGFVRDGAFDLLIVADSVPSAFKAVEGVVDGSAQPSRHAVQPGGPHG